MNAVDLSMTMLVLVTAGVLVVGVVAAARRAHWPPLVVRRLGLGLAMALATWLALVGGLASAGLLSRWDSAPPRLAFLPLAALATMVVLSRTAAFGRLLAAAPSHWPIALQAFRLPVELLLWALFQAGRIPERMTFTGRNLDVLVGVSAPLVAWAVRRGSMGRLAIAAWNLVGLALLANIVILALRSAPGPLNAGWGGLPNTVIAELPFVWLPAFLVPLAVFGHVGSLRQLLRSSPARTVQPGAV